MSKGNAFGVACRTCLSMRVKAYSKYKCFKYHKSSNPKKWALLKCKECGVVFVDPFPLPEATTELYEKDVLNNSKYYDANRKDDLVSFDKRLKLVENFLPPQEIGLSVLDYGCSTGNFMEAATSWGYKVDGIELNQNSAEICRKKGFKVNEKLREQYDLVHAGDVIEHVQNPAAFLGELNSKLKKNGLLIISTPNFEKWITRRTQVKPQEHLFYFTKETLRTFLKKHNFKVLYIDNCSRQRSISSLLFSSTSQKGTVKKVLNLLNTLLLNRPVDWIISNLNDDILAIARRSD